MAFNLTSPLFTGPKVGPTYSRPSDWPVITDTAGEVQMLVADLGTCVISVRTTFTRTASQNITIDWGDGTTNTVSTTTTTSTDHTYTKGAGTPSSRGYTTFVIRVYGPAGTVITTCKALNIASQPSQSYTVPLLEVYYGDGTQAAGLGASLGYSSTLVQSQTNNGAYNYLEYVKMPATVNSGVTYNHAFASCSNLKVVVMPTSSPGTSSWISTFGGCLNLISIVFPPNTVLGNMSLANSGLFSACTSLKSVVLPTAMNSCTSMNQMFRDCFALENIIIPPIPNCTNLANCFTGCRSLTSVTMLGWPTVASSIDFSSMFSECFRLEALFFPQVVSSTPSYNLSSMFSACYNLKTFKMPENARPNSYSFTFANCFSLQSVDLSAGGIVNNLLTTISNVFSGCRNLTSFTLPSITATASVSAVTPFNDCSQLENITIDSNFGNSLQTFTVGSNLYSLRTLNVASMDNVITFQVNGASVLEDIRLPATMSSCVSFSIQSCPFIKTVDLPSLSPSLTTLSFNAMRGLKTINNMPTTSGITTFSLMFQNCFSLTSITLPSTTGSVVSYNNAFQNCLSLESIVFPTTQVTSNAMVFTGMFQNCASLTSITNFDKANSTAITGQPDANNNSGMMLLPGLTFSSRLSKLAINGLTTLSARNKITSLRLTNTTTSQWAGTSPQIDISLTDITYANLVTLFNDIAAQGNVTSKTINITGCAGAGSLTAGDRLIITSKGWTITG